MKLAMLLTLALVILTFAQPRRAEETIVADDIVEDLTDSVADSLTADESKNAAVDNAETKETETYMEKKSCGRKYRSCGWWKQCCSGLTCRSGRFMGRKCF